MKIFICRFKFYLSLLLWSYLHVVIIGSAENPDPVLTQIYNTIWFQYALEYHFISYIMVPFPGHQLGSLEKTPVISV